MGIQSISSGINSVDKGIKKNYFAAATVQRTYVHDVIGPATQTETAKTKITNLRI